MAALSDKTALAGDVGFRGRVSAAVVETAGTVLAADTATATGQVAARRALAARALADMATVGDLFAMSVAIHDPIVDAYALAVRDHAKVTDTAIRARVQQLWDVLANATAAG